MSLSKPASGLHSVFGGMKGRLASAVAALALALALASVSFGPVLAQSPPAAPVAAPAEAQPNPMQQAAPAPGRATVPDPAQAQAMAMPPYPSFASPRIMEPVAMAACRSCRENCFKDYGGPCTTESCARALPLCMRNCWHAVCR